MVLETIVFGDSIVERFVSSSNLICFYLNLFSHMGIDSLDIYQNKLKKFFHYSVNKLIMVLPLASVGTSFSYSNLLHMYVCERDNKTIYMSWSLGLDFKLWFCNGLVAFTHLP